MDSKFSHILMKWNHKDAIFAKRGRIFYSAAKIFRPFGKLLKRATPKKECAASSTRRKGKGQARRAALNDEGWRENKAGSMAGEEAEATEWWKLHCQSSSEIIRVECRRTQVGTRQLTKLAGYSPLQSMVAVSCASLESLYVLMSLMRYCSNHFW